MRQNFVAHRPVRFERRLRLRAVGHHAFLAALAENAKHLPLAVDVAEVEPGKLAHAQAGGVEQLEDRAVALQHEFRFFLGSRRRGPAAPGFFRGAAAEIVEEAVQLFRRQHARHALGQLRRAHEPRRIRPREFFADAELEKRPQRGKLQRHRSFFEPPVVERADVFADDAVIDFAERQRLLARRRQERLELLEVAAVFAERARRRVALVAQVLHESLDRLFHRRDYMPKRAACCSIPSLSRGVVNKPRTRHQTPQNFILEMRHPSCIIIMRHFGG